MDCLDAPSPLRQATVPPVPDLLDNGTGACHNILQMVNDGDHKPLVSSMVSLDYEQPYNV